MRTSAMSQLDGLREELAYLKIWLGIVAVSDISLVGWTFANFFSAELPLGVGAMMAVAVLTFAGVVVHRLIRVRIEEVRRL